MLPLIGITVGICAALMLALTLLVRKLAATGGKLPVTPEWIDEICVERYRPMMRLLSTGDLEFLRSQPGYSPRMAARLRAQRCHIFLGYLRCLSADFARVCSALKILMVQSRYDRPDLAVALLRNQARFGILMAAVYFRVFFFRWGFGSVDVRALVQVFDNMRLELRTLVPAPAAMTA
jgi:hypothetical protein